MAWQNDYVDVVLWDPRVWLVGWLVAGLNIFGIRAHALAVDLTDKGTCIGSGLD
jgi:hypothetical protein